MSKKFKFEIDIEVSKTEGKSMPDEDIIEAIRAELEDSEPGTIYVEDSEYSIDKYLVTNANEASIK